MRIYLNFFLKMNHTKRHKIHSRNSFKKLQHKYVLKQPIFFKEFYSTGRSDFILFLARRDSSLRLAQSKSVTSQSPLLLFFYSTLRIKQLVVLLNLSHFLVSICTETNQADAFKYSFCLLEHVHFALVSFRFCKRTKKIR